ncbi:hypothetical protein U9M48_035397 [Paspalum notatum var. saurae]|uniref:B box-type domain-containing protein n=1 Tax=Paspalum notatum var. saurae TaxID=547442 RepID=A0AAQ3X8C3_PASNO
MKIGCDACGQAEAAVLCCADEAALCRRCDAAVHSANKLAGRHHRVVLLPSTGASPNAVIDGSSGGHPACDICQEKTGYFFCLEDRALLCRCCDVAVHTAGANVSSHRRFLITGVRVGDVESHDHVQGVDGAVSNVISPSSSGGNASSSAPSSVNNPMTVPEKVRPSSSSVHVMAASDGIVGQQWSWSEFLAEDDVGSGMEPCCTANLSDPGSPSQTG